MTNQEIKTVGQTIAQETQIGGNTAARVGGVVEGIGVALDNKDAANGYYQATISGGTITVNAPNYLLGTGGNLRIKMPSVGTTASTLTIGNANAVQLWYNGAAVSAQNTWEANEIISVFYDGTRFMASNSQGGGGDAERIKYDNQDSRFSSRNVQGVLDEIGENIDGIHSNVFATGLIDANCSWCSLGTSITWYNNHVSSSFTKGYQTRVMEKIKFSSFINGGINGGTIATGGGKTGLGDSLSTISFADFYTIEHGINDWGTGIPVGTMDDYVNDTGTSTFMGAYRKVIDYIKGLNSDAKIILCTPRKAYGFNNYLPAYWYAPKNGIYLKDYVDAVKEIAEYESLVVCDWFAESGANQDNLANLSIDVALHPNDKGYEAMANLLISSMRKIFNIFETDSIYIGEGGAKKQTVLPSLSSGGTGWINKNGTTLGPSIAALRNSIITKIFSSVSKTGTMIVRVINPNTQTIINTYTVTGFSGTEMDVSSLNMNVPKGCYVLFGNQITSGTVNSMFAFVTNAGTPHTEASVSEIRLDKYPTMSITLGYELTSI